MIGGGPKIGGPGGLPPATVQQPQGDAAKPATTGQQPLAQTPSDSFEKATARAGANKPAAMTKEKSGTADVLKMARENPAQAKQMIAAMAAKTQQNRNKVHEELAGARAALEQLGAQDFAKRALEEKRRELRRKRDKIAAMKVRVQLSARKMALLQQLAGKLGDPALEEELERLLGHHDELNTDWGRRHHLLSIAETFYGAGEDTPEHLREVVRADVRSGNMGESVGYSLQEISPRRVIAELIARTLDGSVIEAEDDEAITGAKGEHGPTLQTWAAVGEVMSASLARDPLAKKDEE